ncbi:MAG TPA: DUF2059 domain-containing protein [Gemmatimonadales bacterium]|nr:DUF2059 domain-containing protein [Gemmatimonadales bacterium]
MTRPFVTAMCGLVLIALPARGQDSTKHVDAATAASARRLLAATGATKLMLGNLETMIASQRQGNPQIPPAFWDAFLAHARRDTTRLVELLVPIYASHLTQSELEELLKFYNSPIGQRLTAVQPEIFKESMAAGERWGEVIARAVSDSLQQAQGSRPPE